MLYRSFLLTIIIDIVNRQYLFLIYFFFIAYIILLLAAIYDPRGHDLIRNFKSPIGLWGGGIVVRKNELYKPFTSPIPPLRSTSETNDNPCCFKLYFKFLFSCSVVVFTVLIFHAIVLLFFSMSRRRRRRP